MVASEDEDEAVPRARVDAGAAGHVDHGGQLDDDGRPECGCRRRYTRRRYGRSSTRPARLSRPSVGASIISIAEYFKRRADERRPPLIDVEFSDGRSEHNYNHAQSRAMRGTVATRDRKQEDTDEEESRLAATHALSGELLLPAGGVAV